jgi:hypothetical protein
MLHPPFKLAAASARSELFRPSIVEDDGPPAHGRARLGQLSSNFHCSVIGTCLSTAELRKVMGRFVDVHGVSDLDIHHDAVKLASEGGPAAKALNKALELRHAATVQRFGRAHDAQALASLWDEALRQGEVPGAYWAVLTHKEITPDIRKKVFGDVHMLSHLVGAANRADIRRLVALEQDNAELRQRLDRQQARSHETLEERDRTIDRLEKALAHAEGLRANADGGSTAAHREDAEAAGSLIALQTERRERAEQAAAMAVESARQLQETLDHLREHAMTLGRELAAAENQLREWGSDDGAGALDPHLRGRRILYVGGRPSSTPTIRDLVLRYGGEFQRHDGGFEDRKGLLASAVAWAQLVVFPVDCVDHDSVGNLKRLCARQGVGYLPLRSAGVGSFAAALASLSIEPGEGAARPGGPICLRHG